MDNCQKNTIDVVSLKQTKFQTITDKVPFLKLFQIMQINLWFFEKVFYFYGTKKLNHMKKFIPVVAVAALAMMFTSCKKDYKCTCTVTAAGSSTSATYDLGKQKKKDAEAACSAKATSVAGMSYSCKLD